MHIILQEVETFNTLGFCGRFRLVVLVLNLGGMMMVVVLESKNQVPEIAVQLDHEA